MALFKKEGEGVSEKSQTPTNQVLELKQKGLTNDQIMQSLQKDGFTSKQVFDAMSQADIKKGVETAQHNIQKEPVSKIHETSKPPLPRPDLEPPTYVPPKVHKPKEHSTSDKIEQIAEAIIDEKWNDLVKDINKIIEWKTKMEGKISKFDEDSENLKENFDILHRAIISKIDGYDKNLSDVGSEIKAMSEVFKQILPTFTENINALSRITKKLTKTPKTKK